MYAHLIRAATQLCAPKVERYGISASRRSDEDVTATLRTGYESDTKFGDLRGSAADAG
jgi:hypothetical protein